jgi:HTH-type transcriptional regulator/antitoxin HipB
LAFIRSPNELALFAMSQRKKLKLSQVEVGQLVGLKQSTVSAFENKPHGTQLETLFRLLSALNLELNLSEKNEPTRAPSAWKDEW